MIGADVACKIGDAASHSMKVLGVSFGPDVLFKSYGFFRVFNRLLH